MVDGVILYLESWSATPAAWATLALDVILTVLVLDAMLRFGATICKPRRYFADRWNCVDLLLLVGLLCLPDDFAYLALLRLPRFWRSSRILRGLGFAKLLLFSLRRSFLRCCLACYNWLRSLP